jgi:8-oxo-dGTP pyrophosphatase MutT (NUDIX family)
LHLFVKKQIGCFFDKTFLIKISKETDFQLFLLVKNQNFPYHPDESSRRLNPACKAGGGLFIKKGEVYSFSGTEWIYPRVERKRRDIEDTAMREVEEETGVNQLVN